MTLKRKPQSYDLQNQHTPIQILRIYVEKNKADLNIAWQEILRMVSTKNRGYSKAGSVLDYCEARGSFPQKHPKQQKAYRHTPLISALWRWV